MKKYIVSVASCLFALCMQSCFQDMDHPAFDYPESTGEVPTTPLKMYLPFDEEDIRDKGEWGFLVGITVRDSVLTNIVLLMYFCGQKELWVTTGVYPQYIRTYGNAINITASMKG